MRTSRVAALCTAWLALAAAGAAESPKVAKEKFASGGRDRIYFVAVPRKLDPGKPVPLVLLLHGSGRDGSSLVEKWAKLADQEGFVAVGPNASNPEYWKAPEDGPAFLRELIDHLRSQYPIDARRVYLFGHSAGASFALQIGLLESRYFAAVAIHAGAFHDGEEKWLLPLAKRKLPFHLAVGDRDQGLPLAVVRATRDALKSGGFPVELVEMARHDHWYYDQAPTINQAAWTFLATHALPEDPVYEERSFQ
ncbi:MAG TPA: PHB depolymerase family esterase [Thermoanaerobaculia bacterium]|nr:PHB depolymerase family esterase [Thermoanaerobaculia bacterium]